MTLYCVFEKLEFCAKFLCKESEKGNMPKNHLDVPFFYINDKKKYKKGYQINYFHGAEKRNLLTQNTQL